MLALMGAIEEKVQVVRTPSGSVLPMRRSKTSMFFSWFFRFLFIVFLIWVGWFLWLMTDWTITDSITVSSGKVGVEKFDEFVQRATTTTTNTNFCFENSKLHPLIKRQLQQLQQDDCSIENGQEQGTSTTNYVRMRHHSESQGFGVQFVSYYGALSHALKNNKTFVFTHQKQWNYNHKQCDQGMECFFEPTLDSKCKQSFKSHDAKQSSLRKGKDANNENVVDEEFSVMLGTANFYLTPQLDNERSTTLNYRNRSTAKRLKQFNKIYQQQQATAANGNSQQQQQQEEQTQQQQQESSPQNDQREKPLKNQQQLQSQSQQTTAASADNERRFAFKMISQLLTPPDWIREADDELIHSLASKPGALERWWEGQMAAALFCPKSDVLDLSNKIREKYNWPQIRPEGDKGTIGLHIRRGDRTDLKAKYSVDDYVKLVLHLKVKYGSDRLYVASDDDEAVEQIRARTSGLLTVITQQTAKIDKSAYHFSEGQIDKSLPLGAFVDLFLLSECDHFIGAQRSMFSWIASRIRLGKGKEDVIDMENSNVLSESLTTTKTSCPVWIGNDISNPYGWWRADKHVWDGPDSNQCI